MTRLTLASLFLVAIMVSTVSSYGGIASCCRSLHDTKVQREKLRSYYEQQRPACPIKAVVFTTIRGKRICSDPHKLWTQTSMAYLDRKEKQIK